MNTQDILKQIQKYELFLVTHDESFPDLCHSTCRARIEKLIESLKQKIGDPNE
jgi:hypothetical protein